MTRIDGVNRRIQRNAPYSIGHGYIAIPSEIERENYIKTCFRKQRITIITDLGSVFNDCYITSEAIQRISFPQKDGEKGSCVVYASCPFSSKPIVFGVLQGDESSSLLKENMWVMEKSMGDTTISIQFDPKNNVATLNVVSAGKSKVVVQSKGSEESELNIESSGKVNVIADKEVNATSYGKVTCSVKDVEQKDDTYQVTFDKEQLSITRKCANTSEDTSILINQEGIDIKIEQGNKEIKMDQNGILLKTDQKVNINNGSQAMVKSDTLIQLIDQIQTQISQIVQAFMTGSNAAVAMDGGRTAMSTAYLSLQGIQHIDFNSIKSEIGFLD